MAKYEIMLIVSGSLEETAADKVADEILTSLKKTKVETKKYGSRKLAYIINKNDHGYYYQYNFETDEVPLINEFRRLCLINKNVLRHLIINLEKDYGYRESNNPKKVAAAQKRAEITAERKAQYEKAKEARMAEMNASTAASTTSKNVEEEAVAEKKETTKKSTTSKTKKTTKKE